MTIFTTKLYRSSFLLLLFLGAGFKVSAQFSGIIAFNLVKSAPGQNNFSAFCNQNQDATFYALDPATNPNAPVLKVDGLSIKVVAYPTQFRVENNFCSISGLQNYERKTRFSFEGDVDFDPVRINLQIVNSGSSAPQPVDITNDKGETFRTGNIPTSGATTVFFPTNFVDSKWIEFEAPVLRGLSLSFSQFNVNNVDPIVVPAVTAVNFPTAGRYNTPLNIGVQFDNNVNVTGTPQLAVSYGGTTYQADYISGSGTNTLQFQVPIAAGTNGEALTGVGSINLNGGGIRSSANGDFANLTLPGLIIPNDIFLDNAAPTVAISTPSNPTAAFPFDVSFTFSEEVQNFTLADIMVGNGTASNLQTADNTTFTADITPTAGNVTIDVAAAAATDLAGNDNTAATQLAVTAWPGFSVSGGSVIEGNSGTSNLTFTVTLPFAASGTVEIDYSTEINTGTATAGVDYTATSGTLTFNAGETSKTVAVPVNGDVTTERDESIRMFLDIGTITGNAGIFTNNATGIIRNDDAIINFNTASRLEGSGPIPVVATLFGDVNGGFTVDVNTTGGSATSGVDFTTITGQTLTFTGTNGEQQTFNLAITDDNLVEQNETINLALSNLQGNSVPVDISQAGTATIANDDAAAVTIADVSGAENGGNLTFTATLDNAVDGSFTVDVSTADGTATTADGDYTAITSQTLSFTGAAGETQSFTVTPTDESVVEADETFSVSLSNLVPAAVPAATIDITDGATGTITNDDNATISIASISLSEDGGAGTVAVTLDNPVQGGFSVTLSNTGGTATAGTDFTAINQTLNFAGTAGEVRNRHFYTHNRYRC